MGGTKSVRGESSDGIRKPSRRYHGDERYIVTGDGERIIKRHKQGLIHQRNQRSCTRHVYVARSADVLHSNILLECRTPTQFFLEFEIGTGF